MLTLVCLLFNKLTFACLLIFVSFDLCRILELPASWLCKALAHAADLGRECGNAVAAKARPARAVSGPPGLTGLPIWLLMGGARVLFRRFS
jgi:hypothetical protein